jgi:hypothetical protein
VEVTAAIVDELQTDITLLSGTRCATLTLRLKGKAPAAGRNRGWVNAAGPSLPKMLLSTKG